MFSTVDINNQVYTELIKVVNENKSLLKPISLHDVKVSKYAIILSYYPMRKSKFDIFITLNELPLH